jgi:hypothetical protein
MASSDIVGLTAIDNGDVVAALLFETQQAAEPMTEKVTGTQLLTLFDAAGAAATVDAALTAHIGDAADAHDATAISYAGNAGLSATTVEAALDELDDEKAPAVLALVTDSGANRGLTLGDQLSKWIRMTSGSANTVTVPLNATQAFPIGSQINIIQAGAGATTVVATGGVTINATPSLVLRAQYSSATLVKVATDTWDLVGDLT